MTSYFSNLQKRVIIILSFKDLIFYILYGQLQKNLT